MEENQKKGGDGREKIRREEETKMEGSGQREIAGKTMTSERIDTSERSRIFKLLARYQFTSKAKASLTQALVPSHYRY